MDEVEDEAALPERRISDREREETVARLRAAVVDGCLDLEELGDRIALTFEARTVTQLARVTADLPEPATNVASSRRRGRSIWRNPAFRSHIAAYGLVNGFLVGTWAVTGAGFFWPFFPAAAWGVGLGFHAMATTTYEQQRLARREKRARALDQAPEPAPIGPRSQPRSNGASVTAARAAVLFTDIVGSTQLASALGDQGWSQLRARYRSIVGECLGQHGGTEVNVAGDGILARFDDEVAAVRCAVDLHRVLRHQRDEAGLAPSVRTGVHAGEVVVDDSGDVLGAAVNLVCRVAAEAEPDELLVTEAVGERVGDRFPLEDRGLRQLKGHVEARHLLAVRWD